MRHEDFSSIQLEDILTQILDYSLQTTHASAVHWISAKGLECVRQTTDENWEWTFTAAEIAGQHMWSQPASDLSSLYQLWRQVEQLLPSGEKGNVSNHMLITPHHRFIYPLIDQQELVGVLVFDRPKEHNPVKLVAKFQKSLTIAAKYLRFAYELREARNQSYVDELTGLYNQRYLPIALDHEIGRTKRDKEAFTLLFLDIDFFKKVNDGRGHWVGSRLLVELGKVLKAHVRSCDYCFRYGGDEFIVMLSNADIEGSKVVAERIRSAIESRDFDVEGHNFKLTVSIGLAAYPLHAQTAVGLIQIADQAMYYGKRASRNIVFVAS